MKAETKEQVYLVFGQDRFLVRNAVLEILDRVAPSRENSLGFEQVNGDARTVSEALEMLKRVLEAVSTMAFFGQGKVVWFRDVTFLESNVVGKSQAVKELLARLTEIVKNGLPEGHVLVVSAPGADKRSAFYKACAAKKAVREFAVPRSQYKQIEAAKELARGLFQDAGVKFDANVLERLVEKAGTESAALYQEIQKLCAFVGDTGRVGVSAVDEIVSPSKEFATFDLLDAIGARDYVLASRRLNAMLARKGSSAIAVISGLESHFRLLGVFRELVEMGLVSGGRRLNVGAIPADLKEKVNRILNKDIAGMHSFYVGKLIEQCKRFGRRELMACRNLMIETHERLVRSSIPPELQLDFLVLRLCGVRRSARK